VIKFFVAETRLARPRRKPLSDVGAFLKVRQISPDNPSRGEEAEPIPENIQNGAGPRLFAAGGGDLKKRPATSCGVASFFLPWPRAIRVRMRFGWNRKIDSASVRR